MNMYRSRICIGCEQRGVGRVSAIWRTIIPHPARVINAISRNEDVVIREMCLRARNSRDRQDIGDRRDIANLGGIGVSPVIVSQIQLL